MYFLIFTALIGLLFIFSSLRILRKSNQSRKWKKTEGIIKTSGQVQTLEFSENIISRKEPFVKYEYWANGKLYSNNRIFNSNNNTYLYKKTDKILEKYPNAKQVVVFYNEIDPEKSYLEKASMLPIWFTFLIGLVLIFPSFTLLFL